MISSRSAASAASSRARSGSKRSSNRCTSFSVTVAFRTSTSFW